MFISGYEKMENQIKLNKYNKQQYEINPSIII